MKRDHAVKKVDEGLKALGQALSEGRSETLTRYLEVMAKFHRYSFGNVMLILLQRPDASHVAGFHRWKELGRQVKKGAKGIGILAPLVYKKKDEDADEDERTIKGFKIVHVFDVSDTEGEELPEFSTVNGEPGENLGRLEHVIRESGIELLYEDLPMGTLGESSGGTIRLQPGLTPAETFAVAAHELAHERLHHGERRHETTKQIRETEAEAAAFVVCQAFGLDSTDKSADYIHLYRGTEDMLAESLEFIQKVSTWIIEQIAAAELPGESVPSCEHPHVAVNDDGSFAGTWHGVSGENGVRIECRHCGKFYGYRPNEEEGRRNLSLPSSGTSSDGAESDEDADEAPVRIGRADYEERRAARIERYQERAERRSAEADATHAEARRMADAIPFGQPILVGHHSERRDRNYRDRIHGKFGKSFELQGKAEYWEERARAAETSSAISSDDPEAVTKLRAKPARLEAKQERMKAINSAWRTAGKPAPEDKDSWSRLLDEPGLDLNEEELAKVRENFARLISYVAASQPFPPYELGNNSAEIRRVRERIESLLRSANAEDVEVDHGVCRYVENAEENRVQLIFDGKPPKETRDLLKQHGFRWSRRNTAWQRLLNDAGRYAAKTVVARLRDEREEVEHEVAN